MQPESLSFFIQVPSYTLVGAIKHWLHGKQFNLENDSLYGIRFIWISRSAILLQFLAGLTIVAEIIGQKKIIEYRERLEKYIDLPRYFKAIPIRTKKAFWFFASIFTDNPSEKLIERLKRAYRANDADIPFLLKHREEIQEWLTRYSEEHAKWKVVKKKSSPYRNTFNLFFMIYTSLCTVGLFVWFSYHMVNDFGWAGYFARIIFVIILAFVLRMILFWILMVPIALLVFLLLPFVALCVLLLQASMYIFLEIFLFKPLLSYFYISTREKAFKLTSLFMIIIGFLLGILCA